ncbi:MAG TPA: hypothetical protein VK808_10675 [Bacteroidia bacterium]|jgi:hypothetical protein|nr:hypothetical protein [Bacteroidia bacterium]
MVYSIEKIKLLTMALKGDKKLFKQLMEEAPEFAAVGSALVGSPQAMKWLIKNEKTLAIFVDSVHGNKSALQLLMKEKQYELAAVSNMLNDDGEAELWLEHHGLRDYLYFAAAIQIALDLEEKHNLGGYFTLYG